MMFRSGILSNTWWESPGDPHLAYMEMMLLYVNGVWRVMGMEVRIRAWSRRASRSEVVQVHFLMRMSASEQDTDDM